MKYEVKVTYSLTFDDVRSYCMNNKLYTKGCNEEYTKLSDFVGSKLLLTQEDLLAVAEDIVNHSDKYCIHFTWDWCSTDEARIEKVLEDLLREYVQPVVELLEVK